MTPRKSDPLVTDVVLLQNLVQLELAVVAWIFRPAGKEEQAQAGVGGSRCVEEARDRGSEIKFRLAKGARSEFGDPRELIGVL